jgi:hypothetical protein
MGSAIAFTWKEACLIGRNGLLPLVRSASLRDRVVDTRPRDEEECLLAPRDDAYRRMREHGYRI